MLLDIDFDGENIIPSCCCFAIINKNYDMNSTFRLHRVDTLTHWQRRKQKEAQRILEDDDGEEENMILFVCSTAFGLFVSFLLFFCVCMKVECENKVKCPTGLKMVFENHILFFSLLFFFFSPSTSM